MVETMFTRMDRFIFLRGYHNERLRCAANKDRSDDDLVNWSANGGEQT
ncbi:hypothetical protein ACVWXM_006630 [Bradyrhizobium sp. GM7.3]|jgi:hypothetical protein